MTTLSAGQMIAAAARRLERVGIANARRDAQLLLLHVLNKDRAWLIAHESEAAAPAHQRQFEQMLQRREAREPVHRIIGKREFWGLDIEISPATLEPRPETECLVEAVLDWVDAKGGREKPMRMADIGTGTGAIHIALMSQLPNTNFVAVDICDQALATAKRNAAKIEISHRVEYYQGSYCEPLVGKFDAILSNPPYIRSQDMIHLQPEVRLFDPALALDGGEDGCDAYRKLLANSGTLLSQNGVLIVEIGTGMAADIEAIAIKYSWQLDVLGNDLAGHERIMVFSRL